MVKRIHESISVESVNFTAQKAAKTKQAWRYSGGQILRKDSLMVNGTKYEDPKDPGQPRRKQESNFFITINPNKEPLGDERINADVAMEEMLKGLANDEYIAQYLKFGPKVQGNPKASMDYRLDKYDDVIHSIDWKAGVETGGIMRRLHAHIWLTVTHYSQVQINVQVLQYLSRGLYNAALRGSLLDNPPPPTFHKGLPAGSARGRLVIEDLPYVHVKLLPQSDWTDVMRQYIHKGMEASKTKS